LTEGASRLFPVIRDGLEAFSTTIAVVKRDGNKQPLRVTTTNAFASGWLIPRLPRWRKRDAPLDVNGTDGVLDLNTGEADIAIRYTRTLPTDGIAHEFLSAAKGRSVTEGNAIFGRERWALPGDRTEDFINRSLEA
jgi:LysR family glycine cleavage system transcriptional activator